MVVAVWQQSQETRTFDGSVQLTLINRAGTSQTSWDDFAVFSDKVLQCIDVFVVDLFNASGGEAANAFAFEQWVLLLAAFWTTVFTTWSCHDAFPFSKINLITYWTDVRDVQS